MPREFHPVGIEEHQVSGAVVVLHVRADGNEREIARGRTGKKPTGPTSLHDIHDRVTAHSPAARTQRTAREHEPDASRAGGTV